MSRPLWFVAGAGVGVYAAAKARRAAETLTSDGLRDRLRSMRLGAQMFAEEVAQGRADKETELREQLGLRPHGTPELEGQGLDTLAGARYSTSEDDKEEEQH